MNHWWHDVTARWTAALAGPPLVWSLPTAEMASNFFETIRLHASTTFARIINETGLDGSALNRGRKISTVTV
jgi:hypothetical protein